MRHDDQPREVRPRMQFSVPVRHAGRFLVVTCGEVNIALPAPHIRRIVRPADAGGTDGGIAVQAIYRLTDIAARLEQRPVAEGPDTRIILFGKFDEHYAFYVDTVHGLVDLEAREIRPLPPHFAGEERDWFTGYFLFQSTVACLVNLDWLLDRRAAATERGLVIGAGTEVLELEIAIDGEDTPWAES